MRLSRLYRWVQSLVTYVNGLPLVDVILIHMSPPETMHDLRLLLVAHNLRIYAHRHV